MNIPTADNLCDRRPSRSGEKSTKPQSHRAQKQYASSSLFSKEYPYNFVVCSDAKRMVVLQKLIEDYYSLEKELLMQPLPKFQQ